MPISALEALGKDFLKKTIHHSFKTIKFDLAAYNFAKNPDTFHQPGPKHQTTQPQLSAIFPSPLAFFQHFSDFSDKQGQGSLRVYPWFHAKSPQKMQEKRNSGIIPYKNE